MTGSISFDGSKNVSMTTTVADDSHNHTIANIDNLQTTLNNKIETLSDLGITATATELNYVDGVTSNIQTQLNGKASSSHKHYGTDGVMEIGQFLDFHIGDSTADYDQRISAFENGFTMTGTLESQFRGNLTGNASSATKLQTARTITLGGDLSGSVSFDGSSNVTLTGTVKDDSHNHTITNIDNLQNTLDELQNIQVGGKNLAKETKLFDTVLNSDLWILSQGSDGYGIRSITNATTNYEEIWLPLWTEYNSLNCDITVSFEFKGEKSVTICNLGAYRGITREKELNNYYLSESRFKLEELDTGWTKVTVTFDKDTVETLNNIENCNAYGVQFKKKSTTTTSYTLQIRKVKVEKGGKSTDWSPAPEDKLSLTEPITSNSIFTTSYETGTWLNGNTNGSLINSTTDPGSYVSLAKLNSTNGVFTIAVYQDNLRIQFTEQDTIDAATNGTTRSIVFNEGGAVTFPENISCGYLNGVATHVYGTLTNPSSDTSYQIPFYLNTSTGNKQLCQHNGLTYRTVEGTTSARGNSILVLGNGYAEGTAGNKSGWLRMYGFNSAYTQLTAGEPSSNITIYLPTSAGVLALTTSNVASATKLQTARTINGTSFDGTGNITTSNWGKSRAIKIGNTSKNVNGSSNVTWSLSEIGAAASSHTHNYAGSSSVGGAATSANKLNTNAGSSAVPVYFSNGVPVVCTTGQRTNSVVTISADSVMEIGKYIDFHSQNGTDYDVRMTASSGKLEISGTTAGTFVANNGTDYTTSRCRNARFGTSAPSSLANGEIFFVYE